MADSNPIEEWRDVPEWDGYQISSYGRFRSVKRSEQKIIRTDVNRGGYVFVRPQTNGRSTRKNVRIHRLVAAAFLGPCPDGFEVNHKDGNKLNNRVKNLEYVTPSENSVHKLRMGLSDQIGESHYKAKLTAQQVREIRSSLKPYRIIAQEFGIGYFQVSRIRRHVDWAHVT